MNDEFIDLEEQYRDIIEDSKEKLEKIRLEKKLNLIKSHNSYVGKCYKMQTSRLSNDGWHDEDCTKYYKIIGEFSENEYHAECLEFSLPLFFKYNHKLAKAYNRFPDAEIECEPFIIRSEGIFCNYSIFNKWTEIDQSEFHDAMNECYKQLMEISMNKELSNMLNNDWHEQKGDVV